MCRPLLGIRKKADSTFSDPEATSIVHNIIKMQALLKYWNKKIHFDFDWIFMCLKEKIYLENVFVILILNDS